MQRVGIQVKRSSCCGLGVRKALVLSALVGFYAGASICLYASRNSTTWTGYVTDTHCGTNCQVTSNMTPDLKCIQECVKKGSKYGLWSGKQVYVLEPQAKAAPFAAKNVRVTGTLQKGAIQIVSIESVPTDVDESKP